MDSNTMLYNIDEITSKQCREILQDVYESLEERGYDPINQLTGYLLSGDPGYISSHREARNKICSIERSKIIEFLLKNQLDK